MANRNYRIRIREPHTISRETFKNTYIVRRGDDVRYMGSDETPLALSNLLLGGAAEARFALEDASTGYEAAASLRKILAERYKNHPPLLPVVELL